MRDEARTARHETRSPGRDGLLAQALAKANMEAAWKRVKCNRGSAGVDGLSIAETADDLRVHWPRIRASLLDGGVVMARYEGTPQGGPLSPLSANVLLDEVDRELERRGHRFVRYADDCNVYVRSRRAGERVLAGLRKLYDRLHLKVNDAKTAVAPASRRKFLGYAFWYGPGGKVKCKVACKALKTLKQRIRQLTRRSGGRNLSEIAERLRAYMPGGVGGDRSGILDAPIQIRSGCRPKKPILSRTLIVFYS